ncbi:MAG: hypothetical protein CMK32_09880 [Porticoccaceae bacterium]|nr:hypothetical protein [Porticoccaceae bacterium]
MSSITQHSLSRARQLSDGYLETIHRKRADRSGSSGGAYEQVSGIGLFGQRSNFSNSRQFYDAFRDTAFTAIRPVATRFAQQPLRVAVTPRRSQRTSFSSMVKSLRGEGFIGSGFEGRQKSYRRAMPEAIKQMLPPDSIVLDEHIVTEAFRRPNIWHSDYSTLYSVAASMLCCGSALITWDEENLSAGESGEESPSVYYIPMHWVEPKENVLQGWTITPPHTGESFDVEPGEYVYFQMPDPGDPFNTVSPMRAAARAINTADKIHDANYNGLQNLINPSYAIVAGKIEQPTGGQARRPELRGEQRRKLTELIKRYAAGVLRNGDPIILDGIIEDVKPLGTVQRDVDYSGGNAMTERKIMQAFGVSPVVAGYAENANRAGSNVAHEVFYDVVLNPLLLQAGRSLTHTLGPKYSTDQYRVTVYMESAQVNDPDSKLRRVALFKDRLSDQEARRFMRTGELDIEDEDKTFEQERQQRQREQNNPVGR